MLSTMDQNMERAMDFLVHAAQDARHDADRRLYEHLQSMAASILENRRLIDYLQTRIEALEHEQKSH
jgi:hypothetical protein